MTLGKDVEMVRTLDDRFGLFSKKVMPGDNTTVTVDLINSVTMEEGLRFAVREGGKTVGAGVVAKVLD